MRITPLLRAAATAMALSVAGSVASAQSWQTFNNTTDVNGSGSGPFWNRQSQDQTTGPCNVGAILVGVATNAGCSNENPATLLPMSTGASSYLSDGAAGPTGFYFGAGSWEVTLLGTITGATPPRTWTIYEQGTNAVLQTVVGTTATGTTYNIISANGFYLGISAWAPANQSYDSKTLVSGRSQFAAFATAGAAGPTIVSSNLGRINNTGDGRNYYVGMEDNACVQANSTSCPNASNGTFAASDYDYNDVLLRVTAVPEPGSIALVGFGMVGLAAIARRRRQA